MADTAYPVGHPLAERVWAKRLIREALKECYVSRFMGTSQDSLIYVKDELNKAAGDRITYGLRVQLSGDGVAGGGTVEGSEEALTTYADTVIIDQLRHAVRSAGKMSEQRVSFSIREDARAGLTDWWADRIDTAFFNQVGGNTAVTDLRYAGSNATLAALPASGANARIIYGPVSTTENSLSAESGSSNFQLTLIDRAVTLAKVATPLIRPIKVNGQPKYVIFMHPHQVYSMKIDATANRVTWYDAQKARVSGGELDNPIFNGALGEYNGVIIHESTRVPLAPSTTTVRRAILCGAQAACFGTPSGDTKSMTWNEESFDYKNKLGVEAGMIWGIKKAVFNAVDFGTIVISTHAEAP